MVWSTTINISYMVLDNENYPSLVGDPTTSKRFPLFSFLAQPLFAVNRATWLLYPCLANFPMPFPLSPIAKDHHVVHVRNQLKTLPHTTPCKDLFRRMEFT